MRNATLNLIRSYDALSASLLCLDQAIEALKRDFAFGGFLAECEVYRNVMEQTHKQMKRMIEESRDHEKI